jgi:hypothetical protein
MNSKNIIVTVLVAVVVGAGAFFGGIKYQQNRSPKLGFGQFDRNGAGGQQVRGQGGNMQRLGGNQGMRPVMGEIISQDDKGITVKMVDGSSKIVLISTTTAINKAAEGTKADLVSGVIVRVFGNVNSDGSVTAQSVQIEPKVVAAPTTGTN